MQLNVLLEKLLIKEIIGSQTVDILGIHNDSRKVQPGFIFVCTKGALTDGHAYILGAIERGAVAILMEDEQEQYIEHITYIKVPSTARAASIIVDTFFGSPTTKLNVIGVTGTNGKTTTTNLIEHILNANQHNTGVIGTIDIRYNAYREDAKLTTPLCYDLQHHFKKMVEADVEYVAMEVSSHSLDLGRVHGCRFKTAVFTNLSQDHLDYHHTMEEYGEAKSLLFAQLGNDYERTAFAIFNADDPWSERYAKKTAAQIMTYGLNQQADVRATNIQVSASGTSFNVITPIGEMLLHTKLIGHFNVYNMLAAISAVIPEGLSLSQIKNALEQVEGVEGRFEAVQQGQPFAIVVDYAHTPDSLENVLRTARQLTTKKLICVVGCGGDRDRTKRPIMANIATQLADRAIFTSDNPRKEDPLAILNDMTNGLTANNYNMIVDRKAAIERAIESAEAGDIVIIAGKGHEKYQIIGSETTHFDDKEVSIQKLAELGYSS